VSLHRVRRETFASLVRLAAQVAHAEGMPRLHTVRGLSAGVFVRVVGAVRPARAWVGASGMRARLAEAVLLRVRTFAGVPPWGIDETWGADFRLEMRPGEWLHVAAQDAVLTGGAPANDNGDLPGAPTGARLKCLYPGDVVEAVGILIWEPTPEADSPGSRTPRLAPALHAAPLFPLLVRRVG